MRARSNPPGGKHKKTRKRPGAGNQTEAAEGRRDGCDANLLHMSAGDRISLIQLGRWFIRAACRNRKQENILQVETNESIS